MDIKPIKTESDYRAALKAVESLMDAKQGSVEGERLDVLVTLIDAFEEKHYPMEPPDPVEAIKFEMERKGMTAKELEPMIGTRRRVDEVLNRRRPLTLKMIRRLHAQLGVSAESLIKETGAGPAT